MNSVLILTVITLLTVIGDWSIKLASQKTGGLASTHFLVGALLYGLPALGWFFLMRSHSLAAVGVFYAAANIILLAALGTLAFRESFGWREGIGVGLAVAAVAVMGSGERH